MGWARMADSGRTVEWGLTGVLGRMGATEEWGRTAGLGRMGVGCTEEGCMAVGCMEGMEEWVVWAG